jgi:predicted transcriptional regulator YdeE
MRVIVFVKATKSSEAGEMPTEQLLTEMGNYNEQLVKAGIMQAGEGLKPSSQGARVTFSGKERTVKRGPFEHTNELVAGFWIWKVDSLDHAIEWAKKCPNPMLEVSDLEIRPFFEMEDFGDTMTPELKAQEDRMREEIDDQSFLPERFESGKAMIIAGLNATYADETRKNIPDQWMKFAPQIGHVPGQIGEKIAFGVIWNETPDGIEYLCGVQVSDKSKLPKDLTVVELASQNYAVFPLREHVSKMGEHLDRIFSRWAPRATEQIVKAPCFEYYSAEYNPETGTGGMEVWVPVK